MGLSINYLIIVMTFNEIKIKITVIGSNLTSV